MMQRKTATIPYRHFGRRSPVSLLLAGAAMVLALFAGPTTPVTAAPASCGLSVSIVAAPFAVVDSNQPGVQGPRVATLGARITNTGGATVHGATARFSGAGLSLFNGSPAAYFLNDLVPGESVTAYWPVTYPATFNTGYSYSIGVNNPEGCSAGASSVLTTQSEISASANKLLPTGASMSVSPSVVSPGSLVTVRITGFDLGTIGQGPNGSHDAWLQPIGNIDFDPTCLRLVRTAVRLNSVNISAVDQLYFTNLRSYSQNPADFVAYTFLGLRACSTSIQPYQEAASGTQEKYNSDFTLSTTRGSVTTGGGSALIVTITPDRTAVVANDVVRYSVSVSSSGEPVGYPSNGNPVVVSASIPGETTYVAGSAQTTTSADVQFSTDNGATWGADEPADSATVTDLRWILQTQVNTTVNQMQYDVAVSGAYSGAPIEATASGTLYDGSTLAATTASISAAATETPTPTPTPTPTATPAATLTPEPTASPTPTATPEPTSTPTPTATPGSGPTATPTATQDPGPTPTPTVTPPTNLAPAANDDSIQVGMNTAITFDVLANDTDPEGALNPALTVATTGPLHGALVHNGNGVFTYTPAAGYIGLDTFNYRACDALRLCDGAVVTLFVGYEQLRWVTSASAVAYEDLKNVGWSDWDYNDFVVRITIKQGLDPLDRLAALEINYLARARGAGFYERFFHRLPIAGGGLSQLSVRNGSGALVRERTARFSGDANFMIFGLTRDALPPLPGFFDTNTRNEQPGVVPGGTATLTIYLNDPAANPAAALPPTPWDPFLVVGNTQQEVHLLIPGQLDNTQTVNAAYDPTSPLVGYDLPLARVFPSGWQWPVEFSGIWRAYPRYADYMGAGGTTAQDWWQGSNADPVWLWQGGGLRARSDSEGAAEGGEPAAASRYFASPVTADLNGDGQAEIVIGNLLANRVEVYDANRNPVAGWPQPTGGGIKAAAAIADLDGDGRPEVVVGAADGKLYAWRHDGAALAGWPVTLNANYRILATPAVADIDGDGVLDIVAPAADGRLYAVDARGLVKPGWPVSIGEVPDRYDSQVINSSPRIADLDGNGSLEIIVGSTDKKVYAFNAGGSVLWAYATGDMVLSTPAVADIDPGRPGLETVAGSGDGHVYLLDAAGALIWRQATGWTVRSSPSVADLDGDQGLEIVIGSDDDKVWAWHGDGRLLAGWPKATGADVFSSPAIGDVDGDGRPEVIAGSDDARVYAWRSDGGVLAGWPQTTALSVKGAPALANLDGDPALEVIAGDLGSTLYVWGTPTLLKPLFLPLVARGR